MPDHPTEPQLVLTASGTTASFDGARLRVAVGPCRWTVPVEAIASVALLDEVTVRVVFAGAPEAAEHGLGAALDLAAPYPSAAADFRAAIAWALEGVRPADDGHALITRERVPAPRIPGVVARWYAIFAVPSALVLAVLGLTGPQEPGMAVGQFVMAMLLLTAAAAVLWRVGRRFRSLRILRTRGVEVIGTISSKDPAHGRVYSFPVLEFTTLDGRSLEGVVSVASTYRYAAAEGGERPTVAIRYDPLEPGRASRPPGLGFRLRTVCLGLAFVPLLALTWILVEQNLPR